MLLIFHVALPLILFEIPYLKNKFNVNRLILVIGSLLPDLIDKPLMMLQLENGRGFAHTLLFALGSFIILFLFTRNKPSLSLSYLLGITFHLILDLPAIPLFYPFINYDISFVDYPYESWLQSYTNPLLVITEIIGIIMLLFILVYNKLYSIPKIWNYLKNGPIPNDTKNIAKSNKEVFLET